MKLTFFRWPGVVGVTLLLLTLMAGAWQARAIDIASATAAPDQPTPIDTAAPVADADRPYSSLLVEALPPEAFGGEGWDGVHDEMDEQQHEEIQAQIEQSVRRLAAQGALSGTTTAPVLFSWPLRAADHLADYGYHGISNFVDHDPNFPNQVRDYQCGGRTYDLSSGYNHKGTDFFLWPFAWNKMDNDEVEVIAAAPGIIVHKQDGNYDRSCSMSGGQWNAVYVRHSDGSIAWYGHLKNGSVTSKPPGSAIERGEYLGIVGSSGNSTGPHLHFEVYRSGNQLVDPFAGSCNLLSASSWWLTQTPYYDPAINKVTTGSARVSFPTCPAPTITNIQDSFNAGDTVYFTAYYRDQLAGQQSRYTIYGPDGAIYQQWTHSSTAAHYAASYWWWSYRLTGDAPAGTWRFAVEYNGYTYETYFNVGAPPSLTITAPVANDVWHAGLVLPITWDSNLGGELRLELWRDGDYLMTIAKATPSSGRYDWPVPRHLPLVSGYQVRAISITNGTLASMSGTFSLEAPPYDLFLPATMK